MTGRRPQLTARMGRLLAASVALALLTTITAGQIDAQDRSVSRKMIRQMGVMEKIVDQVLIDSPNFLVRGRDNARGVYLSEFGVLVTFEASLVSGGDFDWGGLVDLDLREFSFETGEDGEKVFVFPGRKDREKWDEDRDLAENEDDEEADEDGRSWRERMEAKEARLYTRGKQEIIEVLLDYGDTLTGLKDGQWVAIAAFLRDSDYFRENKISRLVLKAKMSDLRSYAADRLNEDQMIARIVEEEY